MPKIKENNMVSDLLRGGLIGSGVFILLTVLSCYLVLKINLSRELYFPLLIMISALSGISSGYIPVRKKRENGLANGAAASVFPSILILISMSVAYKGFNIFELLVIACCIFSGAVGGVAAVNIKKKRKSTKKR